MKSAAAQQKVEIIGEKQLWHFSPLFSIAFYIYIYILCIRSISIRLCVKKLKWFLEITSLKYSVLLFNIIKNKLNGKVALQQGWQT